MSQVTHWPFPLEALVPRMAVTVVGIVALELLQTSGGRFIRSRLLSTTESSSKTLALLDSMEEYPGAGLSLSVGICT